MVIGAFPIAKLGFLLLKQLSKPIVNVLKNRAKTSKFFRKYVCIPPATFYHWFEMQTKVNVTGKRRSFKVKPLNEDVAVELGANLLGEMLLFLIMSGILLMEVNRQGSNKAAKEKVKDDEHQGTLANIVILNKKIEFLTSTIQEMENEIKVLKSRPPRLFSHHHKPSHDETQLDQLNDFGMHMEFYESWSGSSGVPDDALDPPVPESMEMDPSSPLQAPGIAFNLG